MAKSSTTAQVNGHVNRIADVEPTEAPAPKAGKSAGKQAAPIVIMRPNMQIIEVPIVGTSPLITQQWSRKAILQMEAKHQQKAASKRTAKDPEAWYISTEGWDGVPAVAFKAAMVNATRQCAGLTIVLAKGIIRTLAQGTTAEGTGLIRIYGEPRLHTSTPRNANGNPDVRYRPIYEPWRAIVPVRFNAHLVSAEQIVNLMAIAGESEGVGEWRPSSPESKTGIYGCWEIEEG